SPSRLQHQLLGLVFFAQVGGVSGGSGSFEKGVPRADRPAKIARGILSRRLRYPQRPRLTALDAPDRQRAEVGVEPADRDEERLARVARRGGIERAAAAREMVAARNPPTVERYGRRGLSTRPPTGPSSSSTSRAG